jgi:RND superfamily putative drug exporter
VPTATLHVAAGPAAGTTIALEHEPLLIGRATGPDSVGALGGDPELSREHARISVGDGTLLIEDLGSSNGTFVNGRRIKAPTELHSGDQIKVGATTLTLELPDPERTAVRPREPDLTTVRRPGAEVTAVRGGEPGAQPSAAPPAENGRGGLLPKIVHLSERRPGRVLVGLVVFLGLAAAFGIPVAGRMHANDPFNDPNSETVKVQKLIGQGTGELPGAAIIALVTPPGGVDAPGTRATVDRVAREIKSEPTVTRTLTYYDTHSNGFISDDRRSTIVVAYFKDVSDADRDNAASRIIDKVNDSPQVLVGGPAAAGQQIGKQVGMDLGKAEGIAFPILFILSLFVFRGVVAALMPLFVGGITVLGTFLVLRIINSFLPLSQFALNVVIGLGLGLAIDYSLFIVWRYREELARTPAEMRTPAVYRTALHRTMLTAGRTISYSAITVAVAMASLCVIRLPFMYSMGLGGAACSLMAVATALIALPALLAVLGHRINALAPARWQRSAERSASAVHEGAWYRLARFVTKRAVVVAIVSATVLILLGIPALGIKFVGVDASAVPTSLSARKVDDALQARFTSNASSAITAIVKAPPATAGQVAALAGQLRRLPGALPAGAAPVALRNGYFVFDVLPRARPLDPATIRLVKSIRAHRDPQVLVTGATATFLDQKSSISSSLWLMGLILVGLTACVLFVMTDSVVLPIKTMIMNALSLSAAFGILVLIFQDGHLESVLDFKSLNGIDLSQIVLIFAIGWGLASDYAVLVLTRIKEAHDAGHSNSDSVAIGLERTGRIVTQAAILFCVAIGAFATSAVIFIKEVGIGIAVAVLIDASIVRALLVPSLMVLLGDWNWWAPAPLRRLHRRIGLSEA